jgi:hypothetical protein
MDDLEEAPDLSGHIEILSYRAVFNGPYSSVYRGKLKSDNQLVAVKVLHAIHGAPLHTTRMHCVVTIQRVRTLIRVHMPTVLIG